MRKKHLPIQIRKIQVLSYLRKYKRENAYAPSLREIAAHLGVSTGTIQKIIFALEQDGKIKKTENHLRNIQIVDNRC